MTQLSGGEGRVGASGTFQAGSGTRRGGAGRAGTLPGTSLRGGWNLSLGAKPRSLAPCSFSWGPCPTGPESGEGIEGDRAGAGSDPAWTPVFLCGPSKFRISEASAD